LRSKLLGITNRILTPYNSFSLLNLLENNNDFKDCPLLDKKLYIKSEQDGFSAYILCYINRGKGIIILMNSESGEDLAWEIIRSVSNILEWPKDETKVVQKEIKRIDKKIQDNIIGTYINSDFDEKLNIMYSDENELKFEIDNKIMKIFPESENSYFNENGFELNFNTEKNLIINYPNTKNSKIFTKLIE
jgi:hypothetical protein